MNWTKSILKTTAVFLLVTFGRALAQAPCACDCDVDGSGGCEIDDVADVLACLGLAPVGACAGADVNCDSFVDGLDVDAALAGFRNAPVLCNPTVNAFFTYQGQLVFGGVPVTSTCDFEFSLWDDPAAGAQIGFTQAAGGVAVVDGLFTVDLGFGFVAFDGDARWLEIAVVCPSGGGALSILTPRTQLTPTPYAVRAANGVGGPGAIHVDNQDRVAIGYSPGALPATIPVGTRLHVMGISTFERGDDGGLVVFRVAGVTEGSISVAAGVVTYGAFTGSHYAWTDDRLERGQLVVLTGDNRRVADRESSEIRYGVSVSARPNELSVLGAYLGLLEPSQPPAEENPHLVMAVGNGELWVADSGIDLQPGDLLISSDVPGHAMVDDPGRFEVGYVIARAAERVDWAEVGDTVNGRKHARISVLFDAFTRGDEDAQRRLAEQAGEIRALQQAVARMNGNPAGATTSGSTAVALGAPLLGALGLVGLVVSRRGPTGGRP